jgi:hypothetical protein
VRPEAVVIEPPAVVAGPFVLVVGPIGLVVDDPPGLDVTEPTVTSDDDVEQAAATSARARTATRR